MLFTLAGAMDRSLAMNKLVHIGIVLNLSRFFGFIFSMQWTFSIVSYLFFFVRLRLVYDFIVQPVRFVCSLKYQMVKLV